MDEYEKALKFWKRLYIGLYFVFPPSTLILYFLFERIFGGTFVISGFDGFCRDLKYHPFSILIPVLLGCLLWGVYKIQLDERIKRLRYRHNRCYVCGYDMRHKPVTCPECGHRVDPLDTWWYEITEENKKRPS